ncbi:MAG: hypothetical protein Q8J78_12515 [Moraxellaceae bacterium]|nr:hypothetical protein [Moraxellaceae bacterium]
MLLGAGGSGKMRNGFFYNVVRAFRQAYEYFRDCHPAKTKASGGLIMEINQHDGKCEKALLASTLKSFKASPTIMNLPEETRQKFFDEQREQYGNGRCGCATRIKNHNDFIRLWTAAGGSKTYDKEAWKNVESQLYNADVI